MNPSGILIAWSFPRSLRNGGSSLPWFVAHQSRYRQGQESDFVHAAHGDSSFRFYDHIDRLHKLEIGYAYSDDVMAIVGDTLSDGTELEPCSFYKGNSGRSRLIAI